MKKIMSLYNEKFWLKHSFLLASAIILIIATLLRLYNLDDTSLWKDEAIYANNSYGLFDDFISRTRNRNSSPIFLPFIYWVLGDIVRDGFSVRFLPMLFGGASIFVTLQLYRVGVSKKIALISAFWLAISPVQVEYSQEVREYSLSVLISCLLIYGFLKNLSTDGIKRGSLFFLVMLGFAPFASYGNILLAGILLGYLLLVDINEKRFSWIKTLILSLTFLTAIVITYLITAKYQMGIGKAYYLLHAYPPEDFLATKKWLIKANTKYMKYALGGPIPAAVAVLSMVLFSALAFKNRHLKTVEAHILCVFIALLLTSNMLAFLGFYPFWGMRQHLFATPLILLATVSSYVFLFERLKYSGIYYIALVALIIIPASVSKLNKVYAEVEDIKSPIMKIDKAATGDPVFIYYGAIPAIKFHFPDRDFYYSKSKRKDLEAMYREIMALNSCNIYLVFSHMHRSEDKKLVKLLLKRGSMVESIDKFPRSRLVRINNCN